MSILKELFDLQKENNAINDKLDALKTLIADQITPYKIGDIIPICGYSHIGKKGVVTAYYLMMNRNGIDFMVRVKVLRQDGSESNFKASWNSYHDKALQSALQTALQSIKTANP